MTTRMSSMEWLDNLAERTVKGGMDRSSGIEVYWVPGGSSYSSEWVIKVAVEKTGTRRRWVEIREPTLLQAVVKADSALTEQGR